MGKKNKVENQANGNKKQEEMEGKFLLGNPKFKKLDNGRYKCVQTGHELLGEARESYSNTKHCRLGLIDYALARNKPPLNMFREDPSSRSRLICKLTGHTVNKSEEHIWKHINGKRFLNMLEKEEAEAEAKAKAGKESTDSIMEEGEQTPEKAVKSKSDDGLKKKKKKKKIKKDVSKITSKTKSLEDNNGDLEEEIEFWIPPVGDRWDFDNGKDRWGSDSELDSDPEIDDANEAADIAGKESTNEITEFPNTTKRTCKEVEPNDVASSKKKKKKIESTS